MVHRKIVRKSIKISEFFDNNKVDSAENTLFHLDYSVKIKTPYGYYTVPTLCRTIKQKSIRLYFTNNKTLECGWEHKLKVNGEWKQIKDIDIENSVIEVDGGFTRIKRIHEGSDKILYDLSVDKVHCFYGNGILSHNTWVLAQIGANAMKAGKNVVHYTLELSETYVGRRYDTILSGITPHELKDRQYEVAQKLKSIKGNVIIKYFPPKGITTKKIETHIDKLIQTGFKPDLIIIDYADLLRSHYVTSDSTYQEAGNIYIELRGLSGEYGIPIWTASQANRSSIQNEIIEADSIADSYAKIMNADFVMSLMRKPNDKLNNTARFHVMKNRFGPDGLTFPAKMDTNIGMIKVFENTSPNGMMAMKDSKDGEKMERQMLFNKYAEINGHNKSKVTGF